MLADVPERSRAQQGIYDRVQEYVGIGMAEQAKPVRDGHATDDQRASLDEGMDVITGSNAKRRSWIVGCKCHGSSSIPGLSRCQVHLDNLDVGRQRHF